MKRPLIIVVLLVAELASARPSAAVPAAIVCSYAGRINYGPSITPGLSFGIVSTDTPGTGRRETIPLTACNGVTADGVLADPERNGTFFSEGIFGPTGGVVHAGVGDDTCADELSTGDYSIAIPLQGGGTLRSSGFYVWLRHDTGLALTLFGTESTNGGGGTWSPVEISCSHPAGVFIARIEGYIAITPIPATLT